MTNEKHVILDYSTNKILGSFEDREHAEKARAEHLAYCLKNRIVHNNLLLVLSESEAQQVPICK